LPSQYLCSPSWLFADSALGHCNFSLFLWRWY
jgi:hypothetical protein